MAIGLSLYPCQQLCILHTMTKLTGVHSEFGILSSKLKLGREVRAQEASKQRCVMLGKSSGNWKRTGQYM